MRYPIVIKRSPLALVKNIILIELVAGFFLFWSSYLANYEGISRLITFGRLRYDYSLIIAASFLQLVITLVAFLKWHNEYYEIREKEVIIKKGIFSVNHISLLLKNIKSVNYRQGIFEKLTNCGTIVLKTSDAKTALLKNAENAEVVVVALNEAMDKIALLETEKTKKLSVLDFLLDDENRSLEFKQSLRWDAKTKDVNKGLEKVIMKTVASFLNSGGGNLIIGVADNKSVFGLEEDYKTLPRQDRDGFENHFNHLFNSLLGPELRQFVSLNFENINNHDVCLVEVKPGSKPAYLRGNNFEEFFIRTGNAITSLTMSETQDYIKSHWD